MFPYTTPTHPHTPTQVVTVDLARERVFGLVLCSDGVTDELKPRDIAERVAQASMPQEGAELLCKEAQDFCMERDRVDDCTAVVVHFDTTSAASPPTAVEGE